MEVMSVNDLMLAAVKKFNYGEFVRLKFLIEQIKKYEVDERLLKENDKEG